MPQKLFVTNELGNFQRKISGMPQCQTSNPIIHKLVTWSNQWYSSITVQRRETWIGSVFEIKIHLYLSLYGTNLVVSFGESQFVPYICFFTYQLSKNFACSLDKISELQIPKITKESSWFFFNFSIIKNYAINLILNGSLINWFFIEKRLARLETTGLTDSTAIFQESVLTVQAGFFSRSDEIVLLNVNSRVNENSFVKKVHNPWFFPFLFLSNFQYGLLQSIIKLLD